MGSYTLKITHDVIKIALFFLPILAIAFVQRRLWRTQTHQLACPRRAGGGQCTVRPPHVLGYFGPVTIKPKTTYGWAWQNTYYTYGYLAGTIEATSLMADPIIEPEGYSDAAAVEEKYQFRPHLKAVIVFFAMSCATTIYTHLDTVMLGFMTTDIDVGYYNAAIKIKYILVVL